MNSVTVLPSTHADTLHARMHVPRSTHAHSTHFVGMLRLLPVGLVAVVTVIIYAGSFDVPMIYDDHSAIESNASIRKLWPITIPLSPPQNCAMAGRPVVNLSMAINYAWDGTAVRSYHVTNLLLHVVSAGLLLGIARRTLQSAPVAERFQRASTPLATSIALLWAVHPLSSEAVVYLTQRTELVMGLLLLLTLYCCIRGWSSERWGNVWFAAAVGACALGMGSKEIMVSAPLLVLLYDRTFVSGTFRRALATHRQLYIMLAATWWVLVFLVAQGTRSHSVGYDFGITAWDYLRTQAGVILHYLRLCFWPAPLLIAYGFHLEHDWTVWLPRGLAVATVLGWTALALKRCWGLGFVGSWFFLILAPTSTVLPIASELIAERRMYLPLAAVVSVVVIFAYEVLVQAGTRQTARVGLGVAGLIITCAALAGITIERVGDYRNEQEIWRSAAANARDNDMAETALGFLLLRRGWAKEAVPYAQRALRTRGDNLMALQLAGECMAAVDQPAPAIAYFRRYFELGGDKQQNRSRLAAAHAAHGFQLLQANQARLAAGQYRAALGIDPESVAALYGLAGILASHPDASIRNGAEATRLAERWCQLTNFQNVAALDTLAAAYAEAGDFKQAVARARQALALAEIAEPKHDSQALRARLELYEKGEPYRLRYELGDREMTNDEISNDE